MASSYDADPYNPPAAVRHKVESPFGKLRRDNIMKLTGLMATTAVLLIAANYANAATDERRMGLLDEQLADAKDAEIASRKATDTLCYNVGYQMSFETLPNKKSELFKICTEAMGMSSDASGFVGLLYEQRSRLGGEPLPIKYACYGKPSLGAPHPDAKGHYTLCPKDD